MRGSVWHIFNCPPSTWFCLLSLLYQNRFHKSNQLTGNCPANHNPLLMGSPSNSRGRVDNLGHHLSSQKIKNHQSFHTHHNMPLVLLKVNVPSWPFVTSSICQMYSLGQVVNHSLNGLSKEAKFLRFWIFCFAPISPPLGMSRTTDSRGHSSIQTQTMCLRECQFRPHNILRFLRSSSVTPYNFVDHRFKRFWVVVVTLFDVHLICKHHGV